MVAAVGFTLGTRGAGLFAERVSLKQVDLWGFGADVVVGLWVGAGLIAARAVWRGDRSTGRSWVGRVTTGLLMAGWVVLGSLAMEHVRALGTWPDVRQAGVLRDATFVWGSLLRPAHPWVIATAAGLGGLAVASIREPRGGSGLWSASMKGAIVAAGAATLVWILLPGAGVLSGWRGTHFVVENLGRLWTERVIQEDGLADPHQIAVGASHRLLVDRWLESDLSGRPLLPRSSSNDIDSERRPPNILLLIIEGLSGDRVRAIHGLAIDVDGQLTADELPRINALAKESVVARRFLNQQQQTNRGTYALLSGELPLIQKGMPRMSIYSTLPPRPYLPGVLAEQGYRTAYLQSADLTFMSKWPFLRFAGFETVEDAMAWPEAKLKSGWGVDDITLMHGALRTIDRMRAEPTAAPVSSNTDDRPWFMTVMTAGSHHPYIVPEDFAYLPVETEKQRVFRYADAAVGVMIDGLRRARIAGSHGGSHHLR